MVKRTAAAPALTAIGGTATPSNDGAEVIAFSEPVAFSVAIKGSAAFLFHRWSVEAVAEKAAAAKNSKAKKTDNVESYVWRNEAGELCIPGEYLRASLIQAARFKQDPRSPRKSAMDLYRAAIVITTELASTGSADWDYLDQRRVTVQRAGVTRVRPALLAGWEVSFEGEVLLPEYVNPADLLDSINTAGRVIGLGDFRPTFGRFQVVNFQIGRGTDG